ncbi:hypothetical protein QTP70_025833 [Hemibagrus guttatus]|uniref:Prolyl 4-hydroxylase alpha subunit domain-containing protein n=1 Tax=Hemibagrus guttatus TaxID=175788 RepID=A0AAE0QVR9_9TELE|nr:hypothetical protein QTP70_025833 [Hemibagrus guttatus]
MRRYRTESEPEPWIEQLIQNYGKEQRGTSVRAHVVGVSDLTESQRTDVSDACMLFLSDGTVFIPAVLSAAAWEHMQELEERDTFSGLDNTTVSVRKFQLNFHMDPELTNCQFYLTVNQIVTVGRVTRHHRPPSWQDISTHDAAISQATNPDDMAVRVSLMKESSVTSMSSQSGFPLSCLMGAWHNDIFMDLLNDAMQKIAAPSAGHLGMAPPTHWHRERLRCRGEECFSTPVSHLLIPEEQREMLTADPGVSSSSETPSGPVPLRVAEPTKRPITAQDRGRDSSAPASDRLEDGHQLTLNNTKAAGLERLLQPDGRSRLTEESRIISPPVQRPHPSQHSPAHQSDPTTSDLHQEPQKHPLTSITHTAAMCVEEQSLTDHVSHTSPSKKSRVHSDGSSFSYTYEPCPNVALALSRYKVPERLVQWAVAYLGTPRHTLIVRSGVELRKLAAKMSTKRRSSDRKKGKSVKKSKEGEVAVLSSDLEDDVIRNGMKEAWRKKTSFSHGSVQLDCEPFPHCVIRNFVQNESFVENLRDELLQLNFHSKSNDLYKFQQSDDLKKRKEHHISQIRSLLFNQFSSWLSKMLAVDLETTVDISCAKYEHTDVLLCHDDELEGRRVAFILYLVPPWDLSDGGTLDLYNTDEHYEPVSIVKSLLPCWNTLLFFEVSPVSFHQSGVNTVMTLGSEKLSTQDVLNL